MNYSILSRIFKNRKTLYVSLSLVLCLLIYFNSSNIMDNTFYEHLNTYLDTIHPNQYRNKLNEEIAMSREYFKTSYLSKLQKIPNKYVQFVNIHLDKAFYIFNKSNISIDKFLNKYNIKCIMSKHDLEGRMPYTIYNTVIINENMIKEYYDQYHTTNIIQDKFVHTLIHEILHIIQRFNQQNFDDLYKDKYNFLYSKPINITNIPDYIKSKYMTNPDSNNTIWLYKVNKFQSGIYIPFLRKNQKNKMTYESFIFDINTHEIHPITEKFKHKYISYHPNEVFAIECSDKLMLSSLDTYIKTFLNSVCTKD